jgi:hypothetical protein
MRHLKCLSAYTRVYTFGKIISLFSVCDDVMASPSCVRQQKMLFIQSVNGAPYGEMVRGGM